MKKYLIHTLATIWNEPPRARHQVANELKKDGIVYFVEKNKIGLPRIELKNVESNVITITPFFPVDYRIRYRTPGLNDAFYKWLFKAIKSLDLDFNMVITFDYTAPEIHNYFHEVIFFSADDNVGLGNFNPKFVINYHTKTEEVVARLAIACVVTSEYMLTKIGKYNSSTYLVPLGAPDVKRSSKFKNQNAPLPILALVGYLDLNMDYPLLHRLLKQFKIVFIGPISNNGKKEFDHYSNAEFVGVKTGNALYELLESVDVCIAPYDIAIINKGLTPNKLWLYLSVGKPVVVTDMPNIKRWEFGKDLVYKCENKDFAETCILAYQNNSPDLTAQRTEIAKNNTWSKRVKQIQEIFENAKEPVV